MNKLLLFSAALVLSLSGTHSARTQENQKKTTSTMNLQTTSTTKQSTSRNQGKVKPNFVDTNNDGICDNRGNNTQIRMHKQLRDGSCGNASRQCDTGRMYRGGSGN